MYGTDTIAVLSRRFSILKQTNKKKRHKLKYRCLREDDDAFSTHVQTNWETDPGAVTCQSSVCSNFSDDKVTKIIGRNK